MRRCHIEAGARLYRNKVLTETSPFDDEITPHYLRHTYGTDTLAAKLDIRVRKEFLGHSLSDVTDGYTKVNDVAFESARDLLNNYYSELFN